MHIQFINRLIKPHVISYTLPDLDIRNIKTTQNASDFGRRMEYSETKTRPYSGFITLSCLTRLNSNILIFDTPRKTHSHLGEKQWNISTAQWYQYYLKISFGLYTIHSASQSIRASIFNWTNSERTHKTYWIFGSMFSLLDT